MIKSVFALSVKNMCRDFCYILYVDNIWKLKYDGIETKQKKFVSIIYVAVQNIRAQPIIKGVCI